MGAVSTLSSKCQITVPSEVRDRLGVGAGDQIQFVFDGTQTVVKPVRSEENPFEKWIGIAPPEMAGMTTEDVIREQREARGWDAWDFEDVKR